MESRSSVETGAAKSSRCMVEQHDAAVSSGWLCDRMESRVRGLMFRVGTLAVIVFYSLLGVLQLDGGLSSGNGKEWKQSSSWNNGHIPGTRYYLVKYFNIFL